MIGARRRAARRADREMRDVLSRRGYRLVEDGRDGWRSLWWHPSWPARPVVVEQNRDAGRADATVYGQVAEVASSPAALATILGRPRTKGAR